VRELEHWIEAPSSRPDGVIRGVGFHPRKGSPRTRASAARKGVELALGLSLEDAERV